MRIEVYGSRWFWIAWLIASIVAPFVVAIVAEEIEYHRQGVMW